MSQRNLIAFWTTIISVIARQAYTGLQHFMERGYSYRDAWEQNEANKNASEIAVDILVEMANEVRVLQCTLRCAGSKTKLAVGVA